MEATGNDKNSSLLRTIVNDCFRPIIFQVTENDLNYVKNQNLFCQDEIWAKILNPSLQRESDLMLQQILTGSQVITQITNVINILRL